VRIVAADGTVVASFTPTKAFASIVYSAAGISSGSSYTVQIDGTSAGSFTAGEASAGGMGGGGMGARPGG